MVLHFFLLNTKLTGLWPFYENQDDAVVHGKVTAGERPLVDPSYQNHTIEERELVNIMLRGWEQDPRDRIDIFEAVRLLRLVGTKQKQT